VLATAVPPGVWGWPGVRWWPSMGGGPLVRWGSGVGWGPATMPTMFFVSPMSFLFLIHKNEALPLVVDQNAHDDLSAGMLARLVQVFPLSLRKVSTVSQIMSVLFVEAVGNIPDRLDLVAVQVEGVEQIRGDQVAHGAVLAEIVLRPRVPVVLGRGELKRKRARHKTCERKGKDPAEWEMVASTYHGMGNGQFKNARHEVPVHFPAPSNNSLSNPPGLTYKIPVKESSHVVVVPARLFASALDAGVRL